MLHFFDPPEEFSYLTRDDPSAFAPPPAFGPFRVLHQVGVGALGPVFRTYEPTRDRLVAVKVFRLDITPEQAQSLAEALALAAEAALFHPSVVEPIAAGVEGTVAYRAEEYVAAESLDVALRHYAPATMDKVLPFVTQLAGAIDFARTAGVGHGALHPRDIFVTPDEARATGFGVVEALERVGLRAPVRRPYSAPERVEGREWGAPADVFSLAAITYELLTGRRPAGTGDQIGALTEYTGGDADAIHAVLTRAMDDDPARRFPTALAFASALSLKDAESTVPASVSPLPAVLGASEAPDQRDTPSEVAGVEEEQKAPAQAAIEEETFHRTEFADDEDIVAAHPSDLLDPEPVDLPLIVPVDREHEDYEEDEDDEEVEDKEVEEAPLRSTLASSAFDVVPSPPVHAPTRGYSSITEPSVLPERQRTAILPYAIVGILMLLLGFGAGYTYGTRTVPQQVGARTDAKPAQGQGQGKEFSEQAVATSPQPQPPAGAPPPVPADTAPSTPAPAAPRATPKAATTGSITINSIPTRAGVSVDGKWSGRTPLTLANLRFGSYTIRIVQDGYRSERHVVPLTAQSPARAISAKLERLPGTAAAKEPPPPTKRTGALYVDSRPRGARVVIDEKFVGVTPLQLDEVSPGRHNIRLELTDHQTWRTTATIIAGRDNRVTGSLERIR